MLPVQLTTRVDSAKWNFPGTKNHLDHNPLTYREAASFVGQDDGTVKRFEGRNSEHYPFTRYFMGSVIDHSIDRRGHCKPEKEHFRKNVEFLQAGILAQALRSLL